MRKSRGITQEEIADRLGVHPRTYQGYEAGRPLPDDIAKSVAKIFGMKYLPSDKPSTTALRLSCVIGRAFQRMPVLMDMACDDDFSDDPPEEVKLIEETIRELNMTCVEMLDAIQKNGRPVEAPEENYSLNYTRLL